MLEVAVAIAVLAVGLSGLCALLIQSAAGVSSLSNRAAAHWLAERLAAELSLTPGPVIGEAAAPESCTVASPCPPAEFAEHNLATWRGDVARSLPEGEGTLCMDSTPDDGDPTDHGCDGTGFPVVKLFWRPGTEEWTRHVRVLHP